MEKIQKPVFLKEMGASDRYQTLRMEVNETVGVLEQRRRPLIYFKAFLFPSLYVFCYIVAITGGRNWTVLLGSYCLMGIMVDLNFLNMIHEAVHQTLFRNRLRNKLFVYFFDIVGANSFIWRIRHVRLHHNYPNVLEWDTDFEQSPIARVFPQAPYSKLHRYQHIYLPILYPLFLFNWLFIRDFKDFFQKSQLVRKVIEIPTIEYVKLFVFKAFFLTYLVIIPKIILGVTWLHIAIAFFMLIFTASFLSLIVLVTPHAVPDSEFPTVGANGKLPNSWLEHQLRTTNDVDADNWFTRFFMGSFNYHIAHHLFPSIHHVYYPEITEIIRRFAAAHQLPYRRFPLLVSLKKHYQLLKTNRLKESLFDEVM